MIKECTVQDLKEKLERNDQFVFIDCREQDEWDTGHIKGATLMPLSHFEAHHLSKLNNKEAEIVIQCRSGARSMNLCQFLLHHDFKNITNVRGGIMAWTNAGFPVEN